MNTTHELAGDLTAIEARYAELLQELADLYQLRAQLKRAAAAEAARAAEQDDEQDDEQGAPFAVSGEAVVRNPQGGKANGGKPALRIIAGGLGRQEDDEDVLVNPAHRLAAKQGTRSQLRLVAGGRAAS